MKWRNRMKKFIKKIKTEKRERNEEIKKKENGKWKKKKKKTWRRK